MASKCKKTGQYCDFKYPKCTMECKKEVKGVSLTEYLNKGGRSNEDRTENS